MKEKIFFERNGIRVTNSRFIVGNQTFVVSNITSVKLKEKKPNRTNPLVATILCLTLVLLGLFARQPLLVFFGLVASFIGGLWLARQKSTYYIQLHTAGGERKIYADLECARPIVKALNEAVVYRG